MKKALTLIIYAVIGLFIFSNTLIANSPTDCGLSSYVIKGGGLANIANFVINLSTSLPTYAFGTTSGTLNCKGWAMSNEVKEIYVQNSYEQLSEEIAQGEGTHLQVLALMMGCPEKAHQPFFKMVHDSYPEFFPKSSHDTEKAKNLLKVIEQKINQNPVLSNQCSIHTAKIDKEESLM